MHFSFFWSQNKKLTEFIVRPDPHRLIEGLKLIYFAGRVNMHKHTKQTFISVFLSFVLFTHNSFKLKKITSQK